MDKINIKLDDGRHLILSEDEMIQSIQSILNNFKKSDMYLVIFVDYEKPLVLNKDCIVAINVEEADND